MPPTDATADAGSAPTAGTDTNPDTGGTGTGTDGEDTLDLRLPDGLGALCAQQEADAGPGGPGRAAGTARPAPVLAVRDTGATTAGAAPLPHVPGAPRVPHGPAVPAAPFGFPAGGDLLDHVADWGPVGTAAGLFHLVPVRVERDLPLIGRWMHDPAVAAFWELAAPRSVIEQHVRAQLDGDGRSVPCVGVLDGRPMSYWEIYRADLDPLARHYPARPHDTGIHLLIGQAADRARGLGSTLLRAVADLVLDRRRTCARVVAEPDLRNVPSVAAFLNAGFRFSAEVDLPAKRAALMVRERSPRGLP
ncbi:GNAT family N-acetyltransferase [Streptomyces sp. NPDC051041]|uniref:GNAT family N-acetyltransferase n=1 Tax=Streptomyces sp. NPDC051041 TaxID=3365640 RepID=UPI0037B15B17